MLCCDFYVGPRLCIKHRPSELESAIGTLVVSRIRVHPESSDVRRRFTCVSNVCLLKYGYQWGYYPPELLTTLPTATTHLQSAAIEESCAYILAHVDSIDVVCALECYGPSASSLICMKLCEQEINNGMSSVGANHNPDIALIKRVQGSPRVRCGLMAWH